MSKGVTIVTYYICRCWHRMYSICAYGGFVWHSLVVLMLRRMTIHKPLKLNAMRRCINYVAMMTLTIATLLGCSYDDSEVWNNLNDLDQRVTSLEERVSEINRDIEALESIVKALEENIAVTSVEEIENGYILHFSDGTSATITNGRDGKDGLDATAPVISIRLDEDGNYYWTLDGEWLLVDGERVRANGQDGQDGQDGESAIAPQVRINPESKEWEISTDGGQSWVSTGVVAEPEAPAQGGSDTTADSIFADVDTSHQDYVVITLQDGTELYLTRYNASAPVFKIEVAENKATFEYGQVVEFMVEAANIADYTITKPEGWRVDYAEGVLTVTAPTKEQCCFEKSGSIAVTCVSESGVSAISKFEVLVGEWVEEITLRTLTFEDDKAMFAPYSLDYAGVTVESWSDLIDEMQYGGPLLYADYSSHDYWWYDENNTNLYHSFTTPYWGGGGHAVSNYTIEDYATLPKGYYGWYELQLANPIGGHNGSSNFCIHNGYIDSFNQGIYDPQLGKLMFADGVERVIDHMWVTNTCYVLNSLTYGDGFSSPAIETTSFRIVATGYNAEEQEVGVVEFELCSDGTPITDWQKMDLKSLGKVLTVTFNFAASEDLIGDYGLNCPAYFAYDDVAVQYPERVFK